MEVQILSKKLVTPSPHNHHPRKVKLSSIDQLAPPIYVECIFYYAPTPTASNKYQDNHNGCKNVHKERLERMEKSLSETLTVFYPLAGRYIEDDLSIDCNDQGIEFLKAQVLARLDHLLQQQQPDAKLLSKFIAPYMHHSSTSPLLSVQVNMFECGGFAIGIKISHLVADAYTISLFTNQWAAACRSGKTDQTIRPSFDLASIFPSRDISSGCKPLDQIHPSCPRVNVVTRRFVFDGKAISRLKVNGGCKASRVQLVTALVWRVLMRVSQAKHDGKVRASLLTHAFNMRGKTSVPIPDYSCGNFWRLVLAPFTPTDETKNVELQDMVGLVRGAIGNAAMETAKSSLQSDDIFLVSRNAWRESGEAKVYMEEVDVYDFTSWCSMSHYAVDFGWGRPCWFSSVNIPVDGLVMLLDTKHGDGIEAWASLAEDKMVVFEQDEDIVACTSNGGLMDSAMVENL